MILKTTLSEEENNSFLAAYQNSIYVSKSSYLRYMVNEHIAKQALNNHKENDSLLKSAPSHCDDLLKQHIKISIPAFLKENASKRAKSYGLGVSQWVRILIQFNLIEQPILIPEHIKELNISNRELAAIGRNINQIARKLNQNSSATATELLRTKQINDLNETIAVNRIVIDRVIKHSNGIWVINDEQYR